MFVSLAEERHAWHGKFTSYFIEQDRQDEGDDLLLFVKAIPEEDASTSKRRRSASKRSDVKTVEVSV